MSTQLNKLEPLGLGLLRIVAAFLFWQHGAQKLFGLFGGNAQEAFSLLWVAGLIEFIGALFLAAGLLTRPIAFLLAGEMLVAYKIGHMPQGFWPLRNGGMIALQFAVIFLHLAAAGPGSFAIDNAARGGPLKAISSLFGKFKALTLLILRVGSAGLFIEYGASKLFGVLGGRAVRPFTLRWVAGIMETLGAPLIALGLITRIVAFLLSGEMAVAYWTSHYPRGQGFWPIQNGGEPAVLFCFIYLYLVASGAGPLSIDALLLGKSQRKSARA